MSTFVPVTRSGFAQQSWQRYTSYQFAAQESIVPLTGAELSRAALSLPIAFRLVEGNYFPHALLSLIPGKSLFVAKDGRWLGPYVPAILRGYPFRLAGTPDGQKILVVNTDSGLIHEGSQHEAFVGEDGQLSPVVAGILNFLTQVENSKAPTVSACDALQALELIVPWEIIIKTEQGDKKVEGLFKVDEARLNALPDDAYLSLRQAGALQLAFCQMLSMQHLSTLGKLANAYVRDAQSAQAASTAKELSLEFLKTDGGLNFSGFL